jgi:hypothetical protein
LHTATPRHVRNLDKKNATVTARAVGHETGDNTWATVSRQPPSREALYGFHIALISVDLEWWKW